MRTLLWIAAGSALGGALRYGLVDSAIALVGPAFPWGTLLVNVVGSVVIGAVAGLLYARGDLDIHPNIGAFLMTGLCGGFTTFSFFSLQTFNYVAEGAWLYAVGYPTLSVVLGLLGVVLAFRVCARAGTKIAAGAHVK